MKWLNSILSPNKVFQHTDTEIERNKNYIVVCKAITVNKKRYRTTMNFQVPVSYILCVFMHLFFLNGTYIFFHLNFMISKYVRAKHTLAIISCDWWILCANHPEVLFLDPSIHVIDSNLDLALKIRNLCTFYLWWFFLSLYDWVIAD